MVEKENFRIIGSVYWKDQRPRINHRLSFRKSPFFVEKIIRPRVEARVDQSHFENYRKFLRPNPLKTKGGKKKNEKFEIDRDSLRAHQRYPHYALLPCTRTRAIFDAPHSRSTMNTRPRFGAGEKKPYIPPSVKKKSARNYERRASGCGI